MGDFTIRRATLSDADGIGRVHAASWRETYAHLVPDADAGWFDADRRITMWRANLADHDLDPVVAVDADGVIGFGAAQATPEPDAVRAEELTMLYLLARAHGSGAGQALLDATLADRPASLWVARDNPRALAFYRRNGFTADGATGTFGPIGVTVRLVR